MFSREITQAEKDKGVWWVAVTRDAVLPTINAANPVLAELKQKGLKKEQFEAIFIEGTPLTWGALTGGKSTAKVNVYTRSDAAGAADTWAAFLGGKKQENLKGVGVFGDPGLAAAVGKDSNGIGFNNTIYAYDQTSGALRPGMEVVPIDINGNGTVDAEEQLYGSFKTIMDAIATGKYPSPPARDLYFVSKGKPENPAVAEFLKWILNDGQKYIQEAGYVPFDAARVNEERQKLN